MANKILTSIMVGVCLLFSSALTAQTIPTFIFDPLASTPNTGDNFDVFISVEDFENLDGFQFLITFDESVIQPVASSPSGGTVVLGNTNPSLIVVNASYVVGEGIRISWNSLLGTPVTLAGSDVAPVTAFSIPFTMLGGSTDGSILDIDCSVFDCEIIGVGAGGASELLSPTVPHMDGAVGDVSGGGGGGTTGPLTITATTASGPTATEECVQISVSGFDDLVSIQHSIHWDPSVIQYSHTQAYNLNELTAGNFGTSQVGSGTLTFSWNVDITSSDVGVTVPDGTVIYEVCFDLIGAGGTSSAISFDGTPTNIEVTQEGMQPTDQIIFNNGTVNITGTGGGVNTVSVTVGDISGDPGDIVCVPVSVESFDDIMSFQWSMNWDPTIMTFDHVENFNTNLIALFSGSFNNTAPGQVGVSWNDPSNLPQTLPDGAVLYDICFEIVGNVGQVSPLSFTNDPVGIEVSDSDGPGVIVNTNDGSVTVANAGGFNAFANDVSFCPNDGAQVCVPFTVTGFENIIGIQWTIVYDDTVLDFNTTDDTRIQNANASLLALGTNAFNEASGSTNRINFIWSDPLSQGVTLPDNTPIFEICFDIIGSTGDSSPINIEATPTLIEVTTVDPATNMLSMIPFTTANGSVTLACSTMSNPPSIDESATTITHVNCNGGNDGAINLAVNNGDGTLTYTWSNTTQTTQNITNLTQGTYAVTVTDANGDTDTATFTVNEPSAISLSTTSTNETTSGAGDGTINLTVNGGTAPYTYAWTPGGATSQNLTGLSPATYTVVVTDANNCTATTSATVGTSLTIGNPSGPGGPAGSTIVTDVTCFGQATGSIDLVFSGGTAPFSYNWDNNATSEDINGLAAGTYCITVTDANNNTANACFTINQPSSAINIALDNQTNESVTGSSDGAINVTTSGGTAPYTYSWTSSTGFTSSSEDISGLTAGTYNLSVQDANGCTATASYTITELSTPLSINSAATQINPVSCFGGSDGGINLNVSGGQTPYTFNWSPAQANAANIAGLTAGVYNVTVTDNTGMQAQSSFTITQPGTAVGVTGTTTQESIPGSNDGAIDITPTGGSPGYTYNWSNGMSSQDIAGLTSATYLVTVTDANNCTATNQFTITTAAPPLTIDANASTVTDATCFGGFDGAINVVADGGMAPYTYAWSGTGATTEDVSGLSAGNYTITITDAFGNTASQSFTIGQGSQVVLNANATPESINGGDGAIDLNVSGGTAPYTYAWTDQTTFTSSTQDIAGLSSGTYTVVVTDANGCSETGTYQVGRIFGVSNSTITAVSCFGDNDGSITVATTGGTAPYQWSWSGPNGFSASTEDINGLAAGTYTLNITDSNGLNSSTSYVVAQPTSTIVITVDDIMNEEVPNLGMINITVTGGTQPYTYIWSNGSTNQDPNNLEADSYGVTVTDTNGCIATAENNVVDYVPLPLGVASSDITNNTCHQDNGICEGIISVQFNGGDFPYEITWDNGTSMTITTPNPSTTISGLCAGDYTVTLTDNNDQELTRTFTVTEPDALNISSAIESETNKNNGSITLEEVEGGTPIYNFSWTGPDGFTSNNRNIVDLAEGAYFLTITDANNCFANFGPLVVDRIVSPLGIDMIASSVTDTDCTDDLTGAIDLVFTGGFGDVTFDWSGPNGFSADTEDISNLAPGTYTVVISDDQAQEMSQSFDIIANSDLNLLSVTMNQMTSSENACDGIATVIAMGTDLTYIWCNGATVPNPQNLCAGPCEVVVIDGFGCEASAIVNIGSVSEVGIAIESDSSCEDLCNGFIELTPNGGLPPYMYTWEDFPEMSGISAISDLCAGSYNVTVSDASGQSLALSVDIEEVSVSVETEVSHPTGLMAADGTITLNATGGAAPYTYSWTDSDCSGPECEGLQNGEYWIVVTDQKGCDEVVNVTLDGTDIPCLSQRNIITPDLDTNREFLIACLEDTDYQNNSIEIYNRWGQLVFQTENYDNTWTATSRSDDPLPEGGYFYVLIINMADGTQIQRQGHITVLRE